VKDKIKPASVTYEHRGYESLIELNWTIPELPGPDYLVIRITHFGRLAHRMQVSSNHGSVEEALEAAQGLVRHYVAVVSTPTR